MKRRRLDCSLTSELQPRKSSAGSHIPSAGPRAGQSTLALAGGTPWGGRLATDQPFPGTLASTWLLDLQLSSSTKQKTCADASSWDGCSATMDMRDCSSAAQRESRAQSKQTIQGGLSALQVTVKRPSLVHEVRHGNRLVHQQHTSAVRAHIPQTLPGKVLCSAKSE